MTEDKIVIGNKIRECRERENLSQDELGEKIGVAGNTIHRIESGKVDSKVSNLVAIADALQVPVEDLCPDRLAKKTEPDNPMKEMEFLYSRLSPADQAVVFNTMKAMMLSMVGRESHT